MNRYFWSKHDLINNMNTICYKEFTFFSVLINNGFIYRHYIKVQRTMHLQNKNLQIGTYNS